VNRRSLLETVLGGAATWAAAGAPAAGRARAAQGEAAAQGQAAAGGERAARRPSILFILTDD